MRSHTNEYNPISVSHPGQTLREKLTELGMGSKEFSVRTGKPEKTISEVLNGKSAITPDMAILFEDALGIPARFWLQRQYLYDETLARQKRQQAIESAMEWALAFPFTQMAQWKWIEPAKTASDKVEALFRFFGFSSHLAWEKYYIQAELRTAFRISLAHTKTPHALSAWLRRGELQAMELNIPAFSNKALEAALPALKRVMATHPADFFEQARDICLSVGVKVVITPNLPKAPINGAARWIQDTPLIQLSCRYKRHDIFWFSFFHEIGHILLHGKKEVFLEDVEYSDRNDIKETEANDFAVDWTLNLKEEDTILRDGRLDEAAIIDYAKRFGTHPGIIIGRLHHRGILPHSQGREFLEKIDISSIDLN